MPAILHATAVQLVAKLDPYLERHRRSVEGFGGRLKKGAVRRENPVLFVFTERLER